MLDGIYVTPKKKSNTALIWVHGLTSRFYSGQSLIKELSARLGKNKVGYFKFNTRGHDIVVRGQKRHKLLGTIYERFEDCVHDIHAIIKLTKKLGYRKIILAGHSTGANKILYYLYRTNDRAVIGLALIGGLNDITAEEKRVGKKEFRNTVALAKKLHRKDPLSLFISNGFLFTARRYLSLHTPGTAEDVFPYYNHNATWKELKSIQVPIATIIGGGDEYLDRSPKSFIETFKKNAKRTKSFSGIIIKGANHGFYGKEKELAQTIINWVRKIKDGV